jgi:hypothetical protein
MACVYHSFPEKHVITNLPINYAAYFSDGNQENAWKIYELAGFILTDRDSLLPVHFLTKNGIRASSVNR